MSTKTLISHEEFFRTHPVFTADEFAAHLSLRGEAGARAGEAALAYHHRAGHLVRVRRGLYAAIPRGANPATHPVDPFLVAGRATPDAVLSYRTALEFHGRAYSLSRQFIYSSRRPVVPFDFRASHFRGARHPEALVRSSCEDFGVMTAERLGLQVRVTSLERTLVDVLDRRHLTGSWEEIWRSLESVEFFDLDMVVKYTRLLGNATTAAKVGFWLEQHRERLMVEKRHLEALGRLRPRRPHYLERGKRRPGRLVPRWNLVVPREIIDRSWGEVL